MSTEKLMSRDWVLHDGEPYQIRQLGIYGVNRDGEDYPAVCVGKPKGIGLIIERNEIEPIPLTREILEKNGFTGGEYKSYTGDVWYLKEEGFRKIGLTMSRKESTLWGEKIKPLSPDSIGHNFAVPNIKYVHELQHALRLCGINKEIEI